MLFKIWRRGKMDTVAIKFVIFILGFAFFIGVGALAIWFRVYVQTYQKQLKTLEKEPAPQGIVFK